MPRHFRLIDEIVGVGIFGLLLAMAIVPARSMRDQGQRTQCLNNTRHLSLSLIQDQIRSGTLPPSEKGSDGTAPGHSAWALVLPYADGDMRGLPQYDLQAKPWSIENRGSVGMLKPTFLCPANPNLASTPASQIRTLDGRTMPGNSTFAPGHYGVNWGGDRLGIEGDFAAKYGSCRGVMMAVPGRNERGPNRLIGEKDITDGLAETVLVAERRGGQGWAVGGWAGSEFDAGGSPSYRGADPRAEMASAGSYHGGGRVVVGFCDGSARLVGPGLDRRL